MSEAITLEWWTVLPLVVGKRQVSLCRRLMVVEGKGIMAFVIKRCTKVSFESEDVAKTRAFYLEKMDPVFHNNPLRAYRCRFCRKYHLTSQAKENHLAE